MSTDLKMNTDVNILVADDDKVSREHIVSWLNELGFYKITQVEDGVQAFEEIEYAHAKSNDFTIVFSDRQMPNMDGIELLEKLRSESKYNNLIIFFITSLDEKQIVIQAIDIGLDSYLVKPSKINTLIERLNFITERRSGLISA